MLQAITFPFNQILARKFQKRHGFCLASLTKSHYGENQLLKSFIRAAVLACAALAANQASAGQNSFAVDGAVYSIDYSPSSGGDYLYTLHVDLRNYSGGGSFLDGLTLSDGSGSSNFRMVGDSIGQGDSSNSCDGNDSECSGNSGSSYDISHLSSNEQDQVNFEFTGNKSDNVTVKAEYVDSSGRITGDLVSGSIWLTSVSQAAAVPEPEPYELLMAGFGFLGFVARRKSAQPLRI